MINPLSNKRALHPERALHSLKIVAPFLQVILCSLTFTFFELPINNALGTRILTTVLHSKPDLVNIRSLDEAIVIGAALSLSSSAFVLQLLAEKGELPTRFGSATLGVLLMQVGCTFPSCWTLLTIPRDPLLTV